MIEEKKVKSYWHFRLQILNMVYRKIEMLPSGSLIIWDKGFEINFNGGSSPDLQELLSRGKTR